MRKGRGRNNSKNYFRRENFLSFLPEKIQFKTLQAGRVNVGVPRGVERLDATMVQEGTRSVVRRAGPWVGVMD